MQAEVYIGFRPNFAGSHAQFSATHQQAATNPLGDDLSRARWDHPFSSLRTWAWHIRKRSIFCGYHFVCFMAYWSRTLL